MSSIRVRAKAPGYFGHFREIGDEFVISPRAGIQVVNEKPIKHDFSAEDQFSERWMERVSDEDSSPKSKKGAKKAADEESGESDSVI